MPWTRGLLFLSLLWLISAAGCDSVKEDLVRALDPSAKPIPIRVGVLHSQTGTMALAETSLRHTEILAIEEINAAGGVLGRPIEPVVKDGKSRSMIFKKRAKAMIEEFGVEAVFGCWTSADRKAVLPIVEQKNALLFYPLQYEGNECSPNVVYTGSTPNQQILPALDWFLSEAGGSKKRIALIGSDYVFPRTANYIVRKYLESKSIAVVEEIYVPLGHSEFESAVASILKSDADLILNTINGDSNLYFFRTLHELSGNAERLPVVSTSVGEYELRSIAPEAVAGHYSAWSYFQALDSLANRKFVQAFQADYGDDRVLDDPMEAAYTAVYLWKAAVEKAGSTQTDAVRKAIQSGLEFDAPGGRVRIDPRNQHLYKRFRLGRTRLDRKFDVVYESPEWIAPDPYPAFAFPEWSCDWTQGGMRKGPPVIIPMGFGDANARTK
ncbi:MAG: transporter substrate-binding protein [Pirellula sp.]|jgi:urea transport system substrate-binding protein